MKQPKKKIVLVGGGGHCKSCIEVIETTAEYNIVGILDLPSEFGKKVLDYTVIGNDEDYLKYKDENCFFLITTGQIKSSRLRKKIYTKLKKIDAKIATIIAPTATVSRYATIGEGTIIMHHAFVNAGVEVAENCIINSSSVLEHDVKINAHSHISTTAVVNGDCTVGRESFIGSKVCVSHGVRIGDKVIIGAGSTVLIDCLKEGIYVGSPSKKYK